MTVEHRAGLLEVVHPEGPALPILFDSPHSGREYPADFGSCHDLAALRPAEDAYVDELIEAAPSYGITLIKALFPRSYIDANRAEDDIDPELLDGAWPRPLAPGPKTSLGIGLIRRLVVPGVPIYDRRLSIAEVEGRIEGFWRPYRSRVRELIEAIHAAHGRCLYVQWHSMKAVGNAATPDGPGVRRPDVVLGDRRGTTARPRLTGRLRNLFDDQGFRVRLNEPYAGADALQVLGDPQRGVDALQIELNRGLYLDEPSVTKTADFDDCRRRLEAVVEALATRRLP